MKNLLYPLLLSTLLLLFVMPSNGQGRRRGQRGRLSTNTLSVRIRNGMIRVVSMNMPNMNNRIPPIRLPGLGRFPASRPPPVLGGSIFSGAFFNNFGPPIGRPARSNVTCATEMDEMTCSRGRNRVGILACRSNTNRRGIQRNTTRCVNPMRGRSTDVCGCCPGDSNCPAPVCSCACEYTVGRRNNRTTVRGVLLTSTRSNNRRTITERRCVSPEEAVTLQIRPQQIMSNNRNRDYDCVPPTDAACLA